MIEVTILTYLKQHLSVPVFLQEPTTKPDSYVLFEKTGSGKLNHITNSTFAFQSYGKSLYEAAQLNNTLKEVVESLLTLAEISSVNLNSDYNFTDTETKRYRYQAVFDIVYF